MLCFPGNWIVCIALCTVLAGCSPSFLPIGDHKVFINFYLGSHDNVGSAQAMLCTADETFCGRREEEGYEPDLFYNLSHGLNDRYDEDYLELPLGWVPATAKKGNMSAGWFGMLEIPSEPGDITRVRLNDSTYAEAVVPPYFNIIEPPFESQHHRGSKSALHVMWQPSSQGFPVHWELFPVDNEPEVLPCDMLDWGIIEGDMDDTGVLDIPLDAMPMNLPEEGCNMILTVRLRSEGTLPPELPSGYVRSEVIDGVILRFLP